MRYNDKKMSSIEELIKKLKSDTATYNGPIWYRGQCKKSWNLAPSIVRAHSKHVNEQSLIKKFKQNATMLLNPRPTSEFEWLFMMQHYLMPTRLLDWTESPLIATYFATNEHDDEDGALWILLPVELNKHSNIEPEHSFEIPSFEDKALKNYTPESIASEKTSKLNPIAAIATRNNSRMQSQLSVFTINHRSDLMIEDIGDKKHIWRYIIPNDKKDNIRKELKLMGIGKFQLFPELSSISDCI